MWNVIKQGLSIAVVVIVGTLVLGAAKKYVPGFAGLASKVGV